MKIDFGKVLRESLHFGFDPKRWLQLFVLNTVFFFILLGITLPNLSVFMQGISESAGLFSFIGYTVYIMIVCVVWWLLLLFMSGAIIHQSDKGKNIKSSYSVAKEKFFSLLGASVIIIALSLIVSLVGVLGPVGSVLNMILSIILGLIFFFTLPAIVLKKQSFIDGIKDSYDIFMKNKLYVLAILIIIALIEIFILFIFMIPAFYLFFSIFVGLFTVSPSMSDIVAALNNNIVMVIVTALISIVGFSISQAFVFSALTGFYKQFRKKLIPFS